MEGQQSMVLWIMFAAGMGFAVLLIMAWIFIKRTAYLSPVKRELKKEKQWLRRGEYNAAMVKGRQNLELLLKVVAANNGIRLDNTAAAQANARSGQERNQGRRGRPGRNRVMTHQQFGWWMEENGYLDRVAKWEMNEVRLIGNKAVHENFISKEDAWNQYNYLEDILKLVSEKHPVCKKRKSGSRSRGPERGPRVPETENRKGSQKKNGKETGSKNGAAEKPENEKKPGNGKKPGTGKGTGQPEKKQSEKKQPEKKQTEKKQSGKREAQAETPAKGKSGRGSGAQGKGTDGAGTEKKDGRTEKSRQVKTPDNKDQKTGEPRNSHESQPSQESGKTEKKPSRRRRKKPQSAEPPKLPEASEKKTDPVPEKQPETASGDGQKQPSKKSGNHRRRRRKPSGTAPAARDAQGTAAAAAAKG